MLLRCSSRNRWRSGTIRSGGSVRWRTCGTASSPARTPTSTRRGHRSAGRSPKRWPASGSIGPSHPRARTISSSSAPAPAAHRRHLAALRRRDRRHDRLRPLPRAEVRPMVPPERRTHRSRLLLPPVPDEDVAEDFQRLTAKPPHLRRHARRDHVLAVRGERHAARCLQQLVTAILDAIVNYRSQLLA